MLSRTETRDIEVVRTVTEISQEEVIVLELTKEEATILKTLVGRIAGGGQYEAKLVIYDVVPYKPSEIRKVTGSLYTALSPYTEGY